MATDADANAAEAVAACNGCVSAVLRHMHSACRSVLADLGMGQGTQAGIKASSLVLAMTFGADA